MKKQVLLMVFLALCIVVYSLSATSKSISVSSTSFDSLEDNSKIVKDYDTSVRPQPILRTCGDSINDPRPKMIRPPMWV